MKGIMIQGTSSDSGKSFIAAGLCRMLSNMGLHICPFKSQNMSNNAYVTHDGREISTAQAVQAHAARLTPEYFMNPILLKPKHNSSSEIILNGRVYAHDTSRYREFTQGAGIIAIRQALAHIAANFEAVIIEGAGSPAEVNLNACEIVNMRIAREADVPVILVADVDRGGSLASVAGTLELLGDDRQRVKGIIFNKFRGDIALFRDAVTWTENFTGVKVVGVVPYAENVRISPEDSLDIRDNITAGKINIGVINFPGIANFTDIDPFMHEHDTNIIYVNGDTSIKTFHELDALILPGTKNTPAALEWLKTSGLDEVIANFHGQIFGICGGLQVLGRMVDDVSGLGLVPAVTRMNEHDKITRQVSGSYRGESITGYEIHYGRTEYSYGDGFHELFTVGGSPEGITDGRISGTYLHGVFSNDNFRASWLKKIYGAHSFTDTHTVNNNSYDAIADVLAKNIDVDFILRLLQQPPPATLHSSQMSN